MARWLRPGPRRGSRAGGGGGGFRPGAPGVGDAYFPNYGNGGYDVRHYLLKVAYDPPTDRLTGVATISATATQNLSRFNLDFVGLTVRSIKVNGRAASWSRTDHELMVTPRHGLPKGHRFTTVVRYDGVPITQQLVLGPGFTIEAGFIHTDDGAIVAGQPEVAASWFPVNDHPIDKASYTFVVTAPAGLQVVANGRLLRPHAPRCQAHLGLERPRADGLLPGHGQHRPVRHPPLPDRRRPVDV